VVGRAPARSWGLRGAERSALSRQPLALVDGTGGQAASGTRRAGGAFPLRRRVHSRRRGFVRPGRCRFVGPLSHHRPVISEHGRAVRRIRRWWMRDGNHACVGARWESRTSVISHPRGLGSLGPWRPPSLRAGWAARRRSDLRSRSRWWAMPTLPLFLLRRFSRERVAADSHVGQSLVSPVWREAYTRRPRQRPGATLRGIVGSDGATKRRSDGGLLVGGGF